MEVARLFTRLGFTAFGGPAAHIAMMEDEVVNRRKWIDRQHFLDLVGAVNFIPGPNSTELAIHIGYLRAGWRGLLVAGVCFITPAVLIILPLGFLYVKFGDVPRVGGALRAIVAAVIAVILVATFRFGQTSLKDRLTWIVGALALALAWVAQWHGVPQHELILLAMGAGVGALAERSGPAHRRGDRPGEESHPASVTAPPLPNKATRRFPSFAPLLLLLVPATSMGKLASLFLLMLKVGATLFGSGYVLASYLQADFVDRAGYLTTEQLSHAIAVGQVTPGPLLTTATFIGYTLGAQWFGTTPGAVGGAVIATAGIFLPSFILVAILAPLWSRLRGNRRARGALDGMNAVVVALLVIVLLRLIQENLHTWQEFCIATCALALLLLTRLNSTWLVLGAAVLGTLLF